MYAIKAVKRKGETATFGTLFATCKRSRVLGIKFDALYSNPNYKIVNVF